MWVQSKDQEDPLKKEMATHSSIPAWRATGHAVTKSWTQLSTCMHIHTHTHTHTHIHTHTMEYYSAIKKKTKVLPFAATWMDLKGITLSEISQTEKNILSAITSM